MSTNSFAQTDHIRRRGDKFIYKGDGKLFHTRYDSIRDFSEGRAAVLKKGKWGFIDKSGKPVVPFQYEQVTDFHAGMTAVRSLKSHSWTLVNIAGENCSACSGPPVATIDSLVIVPIISWSSRNSPRDTVFEIRKYPRTLLYTDIDSFRQSDKLLLLVYYVDQDEWYEKPTTAQVITTAGAGVTPVVLFTDSMLQKTVIVALPGTHDEAVLTKDGRVSEFYDYVDETTNNEFLVTDNQLQGVMNNELEMKIPVVYNSITVSGEHFLLMRDSVYQLADGNGKTLSPSMEVCVPLQNGLTAFKLKKSDVLYSIMNADGEILPEQYGYVFPASDGVCRVIKNDFLQYSYINGDGKQTTPWYDRGVVPAVTYTEDNSGVPDIVRGLFAIMTFGLSEMLGFFDGPKAMLTPGETNPYESFPGNNSDNRYYYGSDFKNGYAVNSAKRSPRGSESYSKKHQYVYFGIIDTSGKQLLPCAFDDFEIKNGYIYTERNYKQGLVTMSGVELLKPQYRLITPLSRGNFKVQQDNGFAEVSSALYRTNDTTGKFITTFRYDEIEYGGDSTFIISYDAWHYGFMDYNGNVIVPMKYRFADPFSNGKAPVKLTFDSPWFYINKQGKPVE